MSNVESQDFTPNIHMLGPSLELRTLSYKADVLNHYTTAPHLSNSIVYPSVQPKAFPN